MISRGTVRWKRQNDLAMEVEKREKRKKVANERGVRQRKAQERKEGKSGVERNKEIETRASPPKCLALVTIETGH